jgi:hypothetical protein
MEMRRALASLVILGCGGSKHAPPPAPLPPVTSSPLDAGVADAAPPPDGPTVAKGGDPQDGGEIAKSGGGSGAVTLAMRSPAPAGEGGATHGGAVGGKAGPRPTVSIGKLSIFGPLDATTATAIVKKFRGRFVYCYETALLRDPKLEGTVTLELAVEIDGKVSSATAAGVDRDIDECLRHGALTIAFPPGKKTAKVSVPLAFQPPP